MPNPPLLPVAVFAGFDGSGGAGIIADCRTLTTAGCLPLSVVTAITAQNLNGVHAFWPLTAAQIRTQYAAYAGARLAAIKIGVVGSGAQAIADCLHRTTAPVIWDPVLAPTRGAAFISPAALAGCKRLLLTRATVLTPNRRELLLLSGEKRIASAIKTLFAAGCRRLLITDINGGGKTVRHILLTQAAPVTPVWEVTAARRRGIYHGSGCLFSSMLAARLAHGDNSAQAAAAAHRSVIRAMDTAFTVPGLGRQKLLR